MLAYINIALIYEKLFEFEPALSYYNIIFEKFSDEIDYEDFKHKINDIK